MTKRKREIYQAELQSSITPPRKRGARVEQDWVPFGQIPQTLSRDPKIAAQAKALYSDAHTYCTPKGLAYDPKTYAGQKTLAADLGWHYNTVSHYLKILEDAGWITVKHRGFNQSDTITLHGRRKRVRTGKTGE